MMKEDSMESSTKKREKRLNIKFRIFQGWLRMENCVVYLLEEYKPCFWGLYYSWKTVHEGWYYLSEEKAAAAMRALIKDRKKKELFKPEYKVLKEYTETGDLINE